MNQIEKYFNAEKYESLLFISVGVLQIIVGTSLYFRSSKDIASVNKNVQTENSKIQTEEIPRMDAVMKNFVWYKWIEIAFNHHRYSHVFIFVSKLQYLKVLDY